MNYKMKIQPIDSPTTGAKPVVVVRSRFRRLFRIPGPGPGTVGDLDEEVGPSSVCLRKMVLNYIEESSEKQQVSARCGRNKCNCFNAIDCDDLEIHGVFTNHVCGFLKSLVVCASVNERNVLADTAKVMAENRACKRKDELRKLVLEGLMALGYDAGICKSKWEKSPSFPAGAYEYVDVVVGGERLIIDIAFRAEFEVARSTKTYKSVLQTLPNIFVGKSDRLSKIICILSEAAKQSLKKKGMDVPPWRKVDYVQAKWLSPPTRLIVNSATVTPPPSLLTPVNSLIVSDGPNPDKSALLTEAHPASESEASSGSAKSETLFNMSESSEDDDVNLNVNVKEVKILISPKRNVKIFTGNFGR